MNFANQRMTAISSVRQVYDRIGRLRTSLVILTALSCTRMISGTHVNANMIHPDHHPADSTKRAFLHGILPGRLEGIFAGVAFASFLLSSMSVWFDQLRNASSEWGIGGAWRCPYIASSVLVGMLVLVDLWLLFGDRTLKARVLVIGLLSCAPPLLVSSYLGGDDECAHVSTYLCALFIQQRLLWMGVLCLVSLVGRTCSQTRIVLGTARSASHVRQLTISDLLALTTVFAIGFAAQPWLLTLPACQSGMFIETQMAPNWAYYSTHQSMSHTAVSLGWMEWKPLAILAAAIMTSRQNRCLWLSGPWCFVPLRIQSWTWPISTVWAI